MPQETPLNSEGVVSTNSEGKRVWMPKSLYYSNQNKELCSKLEKAKRLSNDYLLLPTNHEVITIDRMTESSKDIFLGQVNVGYIYKYTSSGSSIPVTFSYEVALYSSAELTGKHGTFKVPTLRKRFHCNQDRRTSEWNREENPNNEHNTPRAALKMAVDFAHEYLGSLMPEAVAFSKEEAEELFQEWGNLDYHGQMINIPKIVTDIGYQTEYTPEDQAVLDAWNEYKQEHVKPSPIRVIRRIMEEKHLAAVHDVRRAWDAYQMAVNGTKRLSPASADVQKSLRQCWVQDRARRDALLECLGTIYSNDR